MSNFNQIFRPKKICLKREIFFFGGGGGEGGALGGGGDAIYPER